MQSHDVLKTLDALASAGIDVVLEGGWAIDALVGRETRSHRDLDIAIAEENLDACCRALRGLAFREIDATPAHIVMQAPDGREVDVHPLLFDDAGNGWQRLTRNGAWGLYTFDGLSGAGVIAGRRVRCTTAALQVWHHLGYRLSEKDIVDLRLLHQEFGVGVPPPCRIAP